MNTYSILLTDSRGTKLASNEKGYPLRFASKNKAELLACKLTNLYYLIQVIPHQLTVRDTNYIFLDDSVDISEIELLE